MEVNAVSVETTEERCNYDVDMYITGIAFVGSYERIANVPPATMTRLNQQGSTV